MFTSNRFMYEEHQGQGRNEGGHNSPRAESLRRASKNINSVVSTFFNTVHLLQKRPQVRTPMRQSCFLPRVPSHLVTPMIKALPTFQASHSKFSSKFPR